MKNWGKNFTKKFFHNDSGAVTMEYVLLATLIAAGALFAVIAFSRSIMDMFHVASYMMVAQPDKAENALKNYRKDRAEDMEKANEWSDSLHK